MISYRSVLFSAIIGTALVTLFAVGTGRTAWIGGTITAVLISLFVFLVIAALETVRRTPVPITIALLGYPAVGKTTYLAVLFDQLQRIDGGDIAFVPSGQRTLEWTGSAMNVLAKGEMLSITMPGQLYILRAEALAARGRRRYAVEMADAAGEYTYRFGADRWLHDDEFFKWTLRADAFLLAVDVQRLFGTEPANLFQELTGLITAVQVIAEDKAQATKRMRQPVAVLLLKDDLIREDQHEEALQRITRLREVLQKRCEKVSYFFVSSLRASQMGVELLPPVNVVEPLVWILNNTPHRRVT